MPDETCFAFSGDNFNGSGQRKITDYLWTSNFTYPNIYSYSRNAYQGKLIFILIKHFPGYVKLEIMYLSL